MKRNIKKAITLLLAMIMVFGFSTTAFAGTSRLTNKVIVGGPIQEITNGPRNQNRYSIAFNATRLNWKGCSTLTYRGYVPGTNTTVTKDAVVKNTGTTYYADYTQNTTNVGIWGYVNNSSNSNNVTFDATLDY